MFCMQVLLVLVVKHVSRSHLLHQLVLYLFGLSPRCLSVVLVVWVRLGGKHWFCSGRRAPLIACLYFSANVTILSQLVSEKLDWDHYAIARFDILYIAWVSVCISNAPCSDVWKLGRWERFAMLSNTYANYFIRFLFRPSTDDGILKDPTYSRNSRHRFTEKGKCPEL